ncbi:TRET1 [Lepeophtheirus salmonis]|uniref:TRET1 n=1 Tax=Lepeophtheirus salmonis TaxID=72036 RepID=A0A0K2USY8_LEPSM|nr:facilitated trehalose transporter Tret1-like [Lepeophtheirus salmonis]XP_040579446.1 facilitated trehalose transporter Tret1-like [Lepeophtheirus salmonis]XP_040579447.1 facilitated trehalose transporter Tret1-like [Lepeophtheirus salmonis]CAB4058587.1 TRET1 [Lepeophtheirus salmonis]CAF2835991.1 TRET1 [Lepeophtheirus salmonis]
MEPINKESSKFSSHHVNQIIAAIAVSFGPFAVGMGKGYTSPALASLQVRLGADGRRIPSTNSASDLTITDQEGSWVASLSLLGALLGGIFSSLILKHGRRRILLFVSLPFSLSWLLTTIASNVEMIYVTAFAVGFCSSIVQLATQVYISEIAHPSIRASLCSSSKVFSQVGLLTSFALGAWLNWRQLAIVCAIGPIMTFIAALNVPETPSFLVFTNQDKRAERSLRWLRGASYYTHDAFDDDNMGVSEELATLHANIRMKREQRSCCSKKVVMSQLFRPLSITCGVMFFTRFSGVTAFNFYAVPIFRESFESFNPHLAAVLTGSVQLISSAMSGILCDLVGRLPLLVISSVLMSGALAGFGVFSYFQRSDFIEATEGGAILSYAQHDWIPLACVVTFVAAFSLGLNPISWLLIGEVFPIEYRSLGPALTTSFGYVCAFIGVKTFVDLRLWLGLFGTFWTYAVIAAIGLLFTLLYVPETKGMSLDEMEPKTCSILKSSDDPSKV